MAMLDEMQLLVSDLEAAFARRIDGNMSGRKLPQRTPSTAPWTFASCRRLPPKTRGTPG